MSKLIDGHIHVTKELFPYLQTVTCIANADNPEEYSFLKRVQIPNMVISAGIHPWKAHIMSWESMEPILREVDVIGEIGLDSEWCTVDLEMQRLLFHRQLELASTLNKPVILHTKGMEQEVLETIQSYPNRYLVHWYSCKDWLFDYIKLGCWFTVGPDVISNSTVEFLARIVPFNRLLIESDGLDGINWGQGTTLLPGEYPAAMKKHIQTVAKLRSVSDSMLMMQMEQNLAAYLQN